MQGIPLAIQFIRLVLHGDVSLGVTPVTVGNVLDWLVNLLSSIGVASTALKLILVLPLPVLYYYYYYYHS